MLRIHPLSLIAVLIVVSPNLARAQAQWDIAGTAALLASHTPDATERRYLDDWFHAAQGGIIIGRHLSRHLKVEIEASGSTRGREYVERLVSVPGSPYPYPVGAEAETSTRSVGAVLMWQFGDNDWIHPFLRAGVSVDFDRQLVRTWDQVFYPPDRGSTGLPIRVADQHVEGPTTTTNPRALVGGGAKFYVSPRAFVRTDGAATFGRSRQNLTFRIGFGVDF